MNLFSKKKAKKEYTSSERQYIEAVMRRTFSHIENKKKLSYLRVIVSYFLYFFSEA